MVAIAAVEVDDEPGWIALAAVPAPRDHSTDEGPFLHGRRTRSEKCRAGEPDLCADEPDLEPKPMNATGYMPPTLRGRRSDGVPWSLTVDAWFADLQRKLTGEAAPADRAEGAGRRAAAARARRGPAVGYGRGFTPDDTSKVGGGWRHGPRRGYAAPRPSADSAAAIPSVCVWTAGTVKARTPSTRSLT